MQQIRLYGEAFITLPKRMLSDTCNLQVAEHFIGINSRMPKNPVTVDKHRVRHTFVKMQLFVLHANKALFVLSLKHGPRPKMKKPVRIKEMQIKLKKTTRI